MGNKPVSVKVKPMDLVFYQKGQQDACEKPFLLITRGDQAYKTLFECEKSQWSDFFDLHAPKDFAICVKIYSSDQISEQSLLAEGQLRFYDIKSSENNQQHATTIQLCKQDQKIGELKLEVETRDLELDSKQLQQLEASEKLLKNAVQALHYLNDQFEAVFDKGKEIVHQTIESVEKGVERISEPVLHKVQEYVGVLPESKENLQSERSSRSLDQMLQDQADYQRNKQCICDNPASLRQKEQLKKPLYNQRISKQQPLTTPNKQATVPDKTTPRQGTQESHPTKTAEGTQKLKGAVQTVVAANRLQSNQPTTNTETRPRSEQLSQRTQVKPATMIQKSAEKDDKQLGTRASTEKRKTLPAVHSKDVVTSKKAFNQNKTLIKSEPTKITSEKKIRSQGKAGTPQASETQQEARATPSDDAKAPTEVAKKEGEEIPKIKTPKHEDTHKDKEFKHETKQQKPSQTKLLEDKAHSASKSQQATLQNKDRLAKPRASTFKAPEKDTSKTVPIHVRTSLRSFEKHNTTTDRPKTHEATSKTQPVRKSAGTEQKSKGATPTNSIFSKSQSTPKESQRYGSQKKSTENTEESPQHKVSELVSHLVAHEVRRQKSSPRERPNTDFEDQEELPDDILQDNVKDKGFDDNKKDEDTTRQSQNDEREVLDKGMERARKSDKGTEGVQEDKDAGQTKTSRKSSTLSDDSHLPHFMRSTLASSKRLKAEPLS